MPDDSPPRPDGIFPGHPMRPVDPLEAHIILNPNQRAPQTLRQPPKPPTKGNKGAGEIKDGVREVVETVVFVVVLVLLLKTFLAEAFVIPTGSMAPTLFGYHKERTCEMCGYTLHINASDEAEHAIIVETGKCQNCHYKNSFVQQAPGGNP